MTVRVDDDAIARVAATPAVREAARTGARLIALWPLTDAKQMDNDAKYAENLQVRLTRMIASVVTGEDVTVDISTLLGRKPSADVPEGAKSVRLEDPTRTISRNHAAISFDRDGSLWIEDYGSLNGTYLIQDDEEIKVEGRPMQLEAPATLRIGDQFFSFEER